MDTNFDPDRDASSLDLNTDYEPDAHEDAGRRVAICLFADDRLLFDYDGDDPDAYAGAYLVTDRNGRERGRGRFGWDNGVSLNTWQPAIEPERQQPRSGQQPPGDHLRQPARGPTNDPDPRGTTAGVPAGAGEPGAMPDYDADADHHRSPDNPYPYKGFASDDHWVVGRPFRHTHPHQHRNTSVDAHAHSHGVVRDHHPI